MQLRYLKEAILKLSTLEKEANGVKIETYSVIDKYKIQIQELNDDVSASIYGADINSMIRITSIRNELEAYLKTKICNLSDNISKYYIYIDKKQYKIKSVKNQWIDLFLTGVIE